MEDLGASTQSNRCVLIRYGLGFSSFRRLMMASRVDFAE